MNTNEKPVPSPQPETPTGKLCMSSPTREHAFSEHEGARTRIGTGKACVWCGTYESALLVVQPDTPTERLFPIQRQSGAKAHRLRIPWSVAEKAHSVYSAKYGTSQSLERMAERGGFCPDEMDDFHPTWREESDEIFALKAELAVLAPSSRVSTDTSVPALVLAMEWGFKASEKGLNYDQALIQFRKIHELRR